MSPETMDKTLQCPDFGRDYRRPPCGVDCGCSNHVVSYLPRLIREAGTPRVEVASSFYKFEEVLEVHTGNLRDDTYNAYSRLRNLYGHCWEVAPDYAVIKNMFGASKDEVDTKVVAYSCGRILCMTLRIGDKKVIVRHVMLRGGEGDKGFVAWMGTMKGFCGPIGMPVRNQAKQDDILEAANITGQTVSKKRKRKVDDDPEEGDGLPRKTIGLTEIQLKRTTLYVTVIPSRGGGPVFELKCCPDSKSFFSTVLGSWKLDGEGGKVAAIAVSFPWLDEGWSHLVKKDSQESFDKMIEIIGQWPEWANLHSLHTHSTCDVVVRILMK